MTALTASRLRGDVVVDGQPPGEAHGRRGGARERTFEITFRDPGVRAPVFTFG